MRDLRDPKNESQKVAGVALAMGDTMMGTHKVVSKHFKWFPNARKEDGNANAAPAFWIAVASRS